MKVNWSIFFLPLFVTFAVVNGAILFGDEAPNRILKFCNIFHILRKSLK